ncbi:MAG: hypothetical protein FWD89_04325 [Firmicutes bacterium]|nr:hypothetical protein [Bacillota bacterium]
MEKKCTHCGSKELSLMGHSAPWTFDTFAYRSVDTYSCNKCGHIDLFVKKDEPKKDIKSIG